ASKYSPEELFPEFQKFALTYWRRMWETVLTPQNLLLQERSSPASYYCENKEDKLDSGEFFLPARKSLQLDPCSSRKWWMGMNHNPAAIESLSHPTSLSP
ncbi:hypothetical protein Ancab_004674, partial [Ancistrocladus abbreviatus]